MINFKDYVKTSDTAPRSFKRSIDCHSSEDLYLHPVYAHAPVQDAYSEVVYMEEELKEKMTPAIAQMLRERTDEMTMEITREMIEESNEPK